MVSEIKMIILENEKVIHTLTKEMKSPSLSQSLEEFKSAANAKLTKMIEELCGSGDEEMGEESDSCDDEEDTSILPKKRKRSEYSYT